MFSRVLIANRGEIAIRVARTCRKLGIVPCGVFSLADVSALHRRFMDDDVCLGPAPPIQSYLNPDAILPAARQLGCEAIHPGYGFLAETADFAKRCEEEGIAFVGPPSSAMALTGDKIASRRKMAEAGLRVTEGMDRPLQSVEEARDVADKLGYPVMLKATAGGGGIGMARVDSSELVARAFESVRSAALANFGNPDIFLERYHRRARHIEIQVVIDAHGHGVHLGERECSVQRRHQKLIEESPSPVVSREVREEIGSLAVRSLESVGYRNAGTVEFLYADGRFHFNEVNARLQVEHPVTEMVTGVDLVELQLRVAAGESLGIEQRDIRMRGHAMECRVNAEDPAQNFAPSPGLIQGYREPRGAGVRVDSGVEEGAEVSTMYDPLIAKLIVHTRDRASSIAKMRAAVDDFVIEGITTTLAFHHAMLRDPSFVKGALWTAMVADLGIVDRIRAPKPVGDDEIQAVAAVIAKLPGGPERFSEPPLRPASAPTRWARLGREENLGRRPDEVPPRRR